MTNTQFARYDTYKDSGFEWLGEVPKGWEQKRIKEVISSIQQGQSPNAADWPTENDGLGVLKLSAISNGCFLELNNKHLDTSLFPKRAKFVQSGDVLITRSNTPVLVGDSCFVRQKPYASLLIPDLVFRLNIISTIVPEFFVYALNSSSFRWVKRISARGLNDSMVKISQGIIKNWGLFLPQPFEQKIIVDYLNTKTAQIDRKIDLLTQKTIQYEKLKQSLINETVTRGLDKTVAKKDSGVEWIEQIPEHWEVKRIKEVSTVINGATPKSSNSSYWDGEVMWVTTDDLGKILNRSITGSRRSITKQGLNNCGTTLCPSGSVVLSCRAPIGHIGLLDREACTNQGCKTLVIYNRILNSIFLYYYLLSSRSKLEALGRGTTFIELSTKSLSLYKIPCPPLPEQKTIANYLDEKITQIDKIVETIGIQIEKLKELRKTLINDVVTGKIKVVE